MIANEESHECPAICYVYPYLSELRLCNFKSVSQGQVPLSPLTLLVGENSSGKSSILQALRLINQGMNYQRQNSIIPLNDDNIRLDTMERIRTADSDADSSVVIGMDLIVPNCRVSRLPDLVPDLVSKADVSGLPPGNLSYKGRSVYLPETLRISWNAVLGGNVPEEEGSYYISGLSYSASDYPDGVVLFSLELQSIEDRGLSRVWKPRDDYIVDEYFDDIGINTRTFHGSVSSYEQSEPTPISLATLKGVVPDVLAVVQDQSRILYDSVRSTIERDYEIRRLFESSENPEGVAAIDDWRKRSLREWEKEKNRKSVMLEWDTDTRLGIGFISRLLKTWFIRKKLCYLGPLREEPRTFSEPRSGRASSTLGSKGEDMAIVIRDSADTQISVLMPGELKTQHVSFGEALEAWASHLGLVETISIQHRAERGPTTMVKAHGTDAAWPLASVGVGVSQLLPVLVLCLLAEPGSVILLEQPELHLHPALQQRLADFLIAVVRSGRQVIVETHSEYMVSRLRRRIVEDPDDGLLKMSKVIFAERDRKTGHSSFREVELTPYGEIEEWPEGFFDQASEEERAIIIGGLKKRREHAARTD